MSPAPAQSPAPEVAAQQADWVAEPTNSPERCLAIVALNALAEAGDADGGEPDDLPPLPDYLRQRWEDAYGSDPKTATPAPGFHWFAVMRDWLRNGSNPLAWGGGLAMALLAVMLFVRMDSPGPEGTTRVATRGTATTPAAAGAAVPIYLISGTPVSDAVLAELRSAFPSRPIAALSSRDLVPAGPAVVLEASPAFQKDPAAAVSAVEAMDEAAATAAPQP